MLRSPPLLVPPTSGFVPLADGATHEDATTPSPHATQSPTADSVLPEHRPREAHWEPPHAVVVRRVEAVVLLALCGYFAMGLGKLLGVL